MAHLEHVNFTVPNPDKTAAWLCDLLDWQVRWSGTAIHGGRSVHVGGKDSYLALYSGPGNDPQVPVATTYDQISGMNHVGIVVDDLDAVEAKAKALGFVPNNHGDYEPGRRFYFRDHDNVEFEFVSYSDG